MSPAGNAIDLRKAPTSRVLLPFILGILAGTLPCLTIREEIICPLTVGGWAGLLLFFRFNKMERAVDHLIFSLITMTLFLGAGCALGILTRPEKPALPAGQRVIIRGEALQEPVSTGTGWLVEFNLEMLVHRDSLFVQCTKLKTYFKNGSHVLPASGERWQLAGTLSPIKNSGNPGEVDYQKIMGRKGYWYRFFVDGHAPGNRRLEATDVCRFGVERIREKIARYWEGNRESAALLRAVCLGDRSGLTDDQKQSYRNAGGMHLLAVSGLHIGLIWWVLHRALSIIVRLFRRELYRTAPIVMLLWCYAFLTGFSSSVCRAVTMFTIFSLALLIDQRTHPLNGLLVSLFLILVIDPGRISDVGLQLSYMAMFGIVTLFPRLRALPGKRIPNRFFRWVWDATSVSIAAQLSTAPLVIFYFHQLPVYALVTNLIAIPALSLLIALFVLTLPFLPIDPAAHAIGKVMNLTATLMNQTMEVIAGFPGAVLRHLDLDRFTLCILILLLILVATGTNVRMHWPRYGWILSVTALLGWASASAWVGRNRSSLIVCHFNRGSQVMIRQGRWVDCYCFTKDSLSKERMIQYLSTVWEQGGHTLLRMDADHSGALRGNISACHPVAKGCWIVGNDLTRGVVISGTAGHRLLEVVDPDRDRFILLHDHPKIPSRHLNTFPKQVILIADGSSSKWYAEKLHASFPRVHVTSQVGAYRRTW